MYCSVKFFEPTVISFAVLCLFSSIRFALISLPASSVLPPVPQAATPSARRSAARSANSGRGRVWMLIWDSSLVGDVLVVGERSGYVIDKPTPIRDRFENGPPRPTSRCHRPSHLRPDQRSGRWVAGS